MLGWVSVRVNRKVSVRVSVTGMISIRFKWRVIVNDEVIAIINVPLVFGLQ